MKGRILGCATNKYIKFIADTGSPVAIVPHSVVVKNKLEILSTDKDEPSYAGVTGRKLSKVGQTTMNINFKTMKTTKKVRAIVVADDGGEVLIDMETLVQWGIIPECFPLPINRVGGTKESVKEAEHIPEKMSILKR